MKTVKITLVTIALILPLMIANATARIQIIHNSPDIAAAVVDVWLNNTKLLSNFEFRTATPFIDAPSGVLLNISIAPPNSTSWTQALSIKQVVLTQNQTYIAVASGILSTSTGYTPSPVFNLEVYALGREASSQTGNTDVLAFHGSPDAPVVDVVETGVGAGTIINNFAYNEFRGYLELPTADYILEIRDSTGMNTVVAYQAPLAGLGLNNQALVLLASGFLNPAVNNNGPAFGLFAALPAGGNLIALPEYTTARVQVIHNSPDAAAASVDIWLNNERILDDFMFRQASPFVSVPAGQAIDITIAAPSSTDTTNPVAKFNYTLTEGETYVIVANGLVVSTGYNDFKPFNLEVYALGREASSQTGNTDVLAFHGSPDAPVVDVVETGVGAGTIIDNFAYNEFRGYLELPTDNYILEVRDSTGMNTVVAYQAPLAGLGLNNQALVLVASGFLNPAVNNNGPAFGLFAALPAGGSLVALPEYTTARVQVIHNSPDAAAASVDIWLNNERILDDFMFRQASPFVSVPAGQAIDITIAAPSSTDTTNPVAKFNYTLTEGETYVIVANGLVVSTGYNDFKPFNLEVYALGRETSSQTGNTDVLAFHGSPDAPVVDVVETGVGAGTIIDNFAYNEFRGYLELPTDNYILEVRDSTGMNTVVAYQAPLAGLGLNNQALVLVASGFLNPAVNNNGPAFGLFAALSSGGNLIPLPITVGMNKYDKILDTKIYPNPAINDVNVQFEISDQSEVRIRMYDLMGKEVASDFTGMLPAGIHQTTLGLQGLRNGTYFVVIEDNQTRTTSKLQIAR